MNERKYTDAEVLKALYCCNAGICEECPVRKEICYDFPLEVIAADLINRQKAEIEELEYDRKLIFDEGKTWQKKANDLQVELDAMRGAANSFKMHLKEAKAEVERLKKYNTDVAFKHYNDGIREFAERLKANMCHGYLYLEIEEDLFRRDVDNLVAEMTEGGAD